MLPSVLRCPRRTAQRDVIGALLAQTPVRRVYTPQDSTFAAVSRYDPSHIIQSVSAIRPARLLADAVDADGAQADADARAAHEQELAAVGARAHTGTCTPHA